MKRFVYINDDEASKELCCDNRISNTKYTLWNFFPKNLMEQFRWWWLIPFDFIVLESLIISFFSLLWWTCSSSFIPAGSWTSTFCWLHAFSYGHLSPLSILQVRGVRWSSYLPSPRPKKLGMITTGISQIRKQMRERFGSSNMGSRSMYGSVLLDFCFFFFWRVTFFRGYFGLAVLVFCL